MKRKFFFLTFALLLCASFTLFLTSCKDKGKESDSLTETGLSFAESRISLSVEEEFLLVLNGLETGEVAEWTSEFPEIASVDSEGRVIAIKEGGTTIRAAFGENYALCVVEVTPYKPRAILSLSVNASSLVFYAGDEYTLSPLLKKGSESVTAEKVSYESGNAAVARVENGKITAVAQGETSIKVTAEYGGESASASVFVKVEMPRIMLVADFAAREIVRGETLELPVSVMNGKRVVTDGFVISWTTDAEGFVSIENGKVTGLKKGSVTLTASCVVDGNNLTLDVPMRVREKYSVRFVSDGEIISSLIVKDGETAAFPSQPTAPERVFSHWANAEGIVFAEDTTVEEDILAEARWRADGVRYIDGAQEINFHEYTRLSEFTTNIGMCNDKFPNGSAVLQPQDKKGDYYLTLPAFDFTAYEEIGFTVDYNYANVTLKAEGEPIIAPMAVGRKYRIGIVTASSGTFLYVDGVKKLGLSEEIAKGAKGLTFEIFVPADGSHTYAQLTLSPMYYYGLEYKTAAEAILAKLPEELTAENCAQYKDLLDDYLTVIGYYTDYEKSVYEEPAKIARLKELLSA